MHVIRRAAGKRKQQITIETTRDGNRARLHATTLFTNNTLSIERTALIHRQELTFFQTPHKITTQLLSQFINLHLTQVHSL